MGRVSVRRLCQAIHISLRAKVLSNALSRHLTNTPVSLGFIGSRDLLNRLMIASLKSIGTLCCRDGE